MSIEAGIDEKGTHAPAYDVINRIACVLDLPVAYFYAEDEV
jgi:hypothetical protein